MSKRFVSAIMACLILAISVPVFGTSQVQAQSPTASAEVRMQEEIAELRALIQALLSQNQQSAQNNAATPAAQISIDRAMEIALGHTGPGAVGTVMLFLEGGVLTYELNITTSAASYTVYINALTGVITGNNREIIAVWQPPVPAHTQPVRPPSSSTHTPSSSSSAHHTPGHSSSSSSSPSGR